MGTFGQRQYRPGMYRYVYYRFQYYVERCTGYDGEGRPKWETVGITRDGDYAKERVYKLNGWKLKEAE